MCKHLLLICLILSAQSVLKIYADDAANSSPVTESQPAAMSTTTINQDLSSTTNPTTKSEVKTTNVEATTSVPATSTSINETTSETMQTTDSTQSTTTSTKNDETTALNSPESTTTSQSLEKDPKSGGAFSFHSDGSSQVPKIIIACIASVLVCM